VAADIINRVSSNPATTRNLRDTMDAIVRRQ
jgi:hypothetical protein